MFKLKLFKRKLIKRLVIWLVFVPILLFFSLVLIVYWKQDEVVQNLITTLNEDFNGEIEIKESQVSPFESFPYISIHLHDVKLFDNKNDHEEPIIEMEHLYLGFNIWDLISGNYDIKTLQLKKGYIHAIQDKDGELNITKALSSKEELESIEEDYNIHLHLIELVNVDFYKLNKENGLLVESKIDDAHISFTSNKDRIIGSLVTHTEMNIVLAGDTTFFKKKHLNVDLNLEYQKTKQILKISPSELDLENATFSGEGTIDIANENYLDIKLYGRKENFDLLIAMAPEELLPTLNAYENTGDINFEVSIKGKSTAGHTPFIRADFACKKASLTNNVSQVKVEKLSFSGYFTNNGKKGLENMELSLQNFSAKPAAGNFSANLLVKNFETPDIEMTLDSDFDLEFLANFVNSTSFEDLHGKVNIHMKFHDIIDLSNPENTIEKLNEAYFTELTIDNLGFKTSRSNLTLSKLDTKITVEGHEARIEYFDAKVGKSDFHVSGRISDLPAIFHHSTKEIVVDVDILSKLIDLKELSSSSEKSIDEQINDLSMRLRFISSAHNLTESPNLPVGNFFIDSLCAKLTNYPHEFHEFSADVFIKDETIKVVDFSGMIDKGTFNFKGDLSNYYSLLEENPKGNIKMDFDLTSRLLKLEDLFSYKGENYVPEEYRHEQLSELKIRGTVDLLFNGGIKSYDLNLTEFDAELGVHPMNFKNFNGRVRYQEELLTVQNLSGKMGNSAFTINMGYFLGKDEKKKKKDNYFDIKSPRLDFDQLFSYDDLQSSHADKPIDHEDVFNIYELPFTKMDFKIDIASLNYHKHSIRNFKGKLRTTPDHNIFIDALSMNIADGTVSMSGYFDGSNKDEIYFSPKIDFKGVNLDKLLLKFENFGQDYLVSQNIQGKITSSIDGKVRMHADLVPVINESEIHIDLLILDGALIDFEPIVGLKEYFVDKNVNNIRFDTLRNHIDLLNGTMQIPNMTINSTLGHLVVSGTQDMDFNMEYYIKVPLKLIVSSGFKSLFGKTKEEVDLDQEDEIEYLDPKKDKAHVNIKIVGNSENYNVSLGREKKKKKRK